METTLREIRNKFDSIRAAVRSWFIIYGLSRITTFFCISIILLFIIDWQLVTTPYFVRVAILAGIIGYSCYICYKEMLKPLGVTLKEDDLALFIEREYPHLKDRLISAVQFSRKTDLNPQYDSPELISLLMKEAQEVSQELDFKKIVTGKYVAKTVFFGGLCLAFVVAMAAACPYFQIFLNRLVDPSLIWPDPVKFEVMCDNQLVNVGQSKVVARGQDCFIKVTPTVKADMVKEVYLQYKMIDKSQNKVLEVGELKMDRLGASYKLTLPRLFYPVEFHIRHAERPRGPYKIDVLNAPDLHTDKIRAILKFPEYLKKNDDTKFTGNLEVPIGTEVKLILPFDQEIIPFTEKDASTKDEVTYPRIVTKLKEPMGPIQATIDSTDRSIVTASFKVEKDRFDYQIFVYGKNNLKNIDPKVFTVVGIRDEPPKIKVIDPRMGEKVTTQCERPMKIEITDDNCIESIWYTWKIKVKNEIDLPEQRVEVYKHDPKSSHKKEIKIPGMDTQPVVLTFNKMEWKDIEGVHKLAVGDVVVVTIFAKDYKSGEPPNLFQTSEFKFTVVSMEDLERELLDEIIKFRKDIEDKGGLIDKETALKMQTTGWIDRKIFKEDKFQAHKIEIRDAYDKQRAVADSIDKIKKRLREVANRGLYNKIFSLDTWNELDKAIRELAKVSLPESSMLPHSMFDSLPGAVCEQETQGPAYEATSLLSAILKIRSEEEREKEGKKVLGYQTETRDSLVKVVDYLNKFTSYQEIVALARRLRGDINNVVWCRKCTKVQDDPKAKKCKYCQEDIPQ